MRIRWCFLIMVIAGEGILASSEREATLEKDRHAILSTSGCYLVDYNYHEVEALLKDYSLDTREYHSSVNKDFQKFASMYAMLDPKINASNYQLAVKEKIWVRRSDANQIHLQHIIFLTNSKGELDFIMKHHSERWTYNAEKFYGYAGNRKHSPVVHEGPSDLWTREMSALDDSPRYSCSGAWDYVGQYPRWTCSGFSPIPGREYRDMGRQDYQALNRKHEITVYPYGWLDTQENEKVYERADGTRTPFVKEKGRNWYVKLPDAECEPIDSFIEERKAFWEITQSVWDSLLNDAVVLEEPKGPPLWLAINGGPLIVHPDGKGGRRLHQYRVGLEQKFLDSKKRQSDPQFADELAGEIRRIILGR